MHKNRIVPNWSKIFFGFILNLVTLMCSAAAVIAPGVTLAGSLAILAAIIVIWAFILGVLVGWIK